MGFFVFTPFSWNSWIPISREFSIANFKSSRYYWSLDSSIAKCDRLIRSLNSSLAEIKIPTIAIPSIANIKIPSIAKFQNSVDRKHNKNPSIASMKNSVDREDNKIPSIANTKIPSIAKLADRGKYCNPVSFFIRKANLNLHLLSEKKFEFLVGLFARRSRDGYLKIEVEGNSPTKVKVVVWRFEGLMSYLL